MNTKEKAKNLMEAYKKYMYPFHDDVAKNKPKNVLKLQLTKFCKTIGF